MSAATGKIGTPSDAQSRYTTGPAEILSFLIAAGAEAYPDAAHKKRQSMPPL